MAYSRPTLVQGTGSAFGTGNPLLTDVTGYVSWSTLADGTTVHYLIQDNPVSTFYEWGLGTKTSSGGTPVLTRTAGNVLGGSSGAGTLVNFMNAKQVIYATLLGEVEVMPNVTSDPSVSSLGQITYRTDLNQFRGYTGSWGALGAGEAVTFSVSDSATTTITNIKTLQHNSTATPAAGFGGSMVLNLDSNTTANRKAAEFDWLWATATDASRKGRLVGYVYDNVGAREFLRAESDGTLPIVGICGAALANTMLTVYSASDTYVGLKVQANSGSTSADLQDWQTSAGNVRARITSLCEFSNPHPNDCTGADNEAFGAGAAMSLTTGIQNVAIGSGAMGANATCTGNDNVAIGFQSLSNLTSGASNMAIGTVAMQFNTTGSYSVGIGYATLQNQTTGGHNLAIGSYALTANTTGTRLVAIGFNALGAVTTQANGSTAIGYESQATLTGDANTSVGYETLHASGGATLNVAFGYAALYGCTGTGNVAAGYFAGFGSSPGSAMLTSGNYNTLIGYNADCVSATQQYGTALGYQAVCRANELALSPNTNFQTFYVLSSTSTLRQRADFTVSNISNTDATRKYRIVFNVWDTAAREAMRFDTDGTAAQVSFFGAGSFGSGDGVIFITNAVTNPSTNPTGGGILYSNAGAGTWRGSGGTVTAFGPAGPHCGACGYDFWTVASRNERWGAYLYECGMCGKVYKKGPKSVLGQLTPEQRAEILAA